MGHHAGQIEVGSLRHMLKTNTKEIHDVADKAMQAFLFDDKETTSLPAYRHFLLQLRGLYDAMETELERNRDHEMVGPICFPEELSRMRLLETDLDFYYQGQWRDVYQKNLTGAMKRYIAHIREVGRSQPELLVAHAYTRYLGDMSGGQILKKMIRKRYSLTGEEGTSFYAFDNIESIGKFKELFTSRMNGLTLTQKQKDDMVEETKRIFQFNIDVFNEVASRFTQGSTFDEGLPDNDNVAKGLWDSSLMKVSLAVGIPTLLLVFSPWVKSMLLKN